MLKKLWERRAAHARPGLPGKKVLAVALASALALQMPVVAFAESYENKEGEPLEAEAGEKKEADSVHVNNDEKEGYSVTGVYSHGEGAEVHVEGGGKKRSHAG